MVSPILGSMISTMVRMIWRWGAELAEFARLLDLLQDMLEQVALGVGSRPDPAASYPPD